MEHINKRNVLLVVLFVLILITLFLLVSKFTYSFLEPNISDDVSTPGQIKATTSTDGETLLFTDGVVISLNATTDNFNVNSESLTKSTIPSVKLIASEGEASAEYYVGFKILNNTFSYSQGECSNTTYKTKNTCEANSGTWKNTPELILTVEDLNISGDDKVIKTSSDSSLKYVEQTDRHGKEYKGFDITEKVNEAFTLTFDDAIKYAIKTSTTVTHKWKFTLTFVNLAGNQDINENARLSLQAIVQKEPIEVSFAETCETGYLACNIAKLATDSEDSNIYYHNGYGAYANAELESADKSYRYVGANPNNYVCFGYPDSFTEEDCNDSTKNSEYLYRIIGVFNSKLDNKVYETKLIKATAATTNELGTGTYTDGTNFYWQGNSGSSYNNKWNESILNINALNTEYFENYLGGVESAWGQMINEHTWKIGGDTAANINFSDALTAYKYEILNNEVELENTRIGLMYVSDYYYSAIPTYWNYPGLTNSANPDKDGNVGANYDYRAATGNNWLYSAGNTEWTITKRTDIADNSTAYRISDGSIDDQLINSISIVRPVFYLNSNVKLTGGIGSSANPYIIGL